MKAPLRRVLANLLALGIASLVCLVIAEVFVRAFIPVRNVGADFSRYHPVYGKALRPDLDTVRITPEFTMTLRSNALGMRGPELVGSATGAIWALGDSFTLGYGVDDGLEFPALLRAEAERRHGSARAVPVLNSGVGNIGSGSWLRRLEAEIDERRPRLVLLQLTGNDYDDNLAGGLFTLDSAGELVSAPLPVPRGSLVRAYELVSSIPGADKSWLIAAVKEAMTRAPRPVGPEPTLSPRPRGSTAAATAAAHTATLAATITATLADERPVGPYELLTERIVERAIAACQSRGVTVVGLSADLDPPREARMRALFSRRGVPLVLGPPNVKGSPLHYVNDRHWNAAGHAAVYERLRAVPEIEAALAEPR